MDLSVKVQCIAHELSAGFHKSMHVQMKKHTKMCTILVLSVAQELICKFKFLVVFRNLANKADFECSISYWMLMTVTFKTVIH